MFDDVCSALRDVIYDAIEADICSEDSILRDAIEVEGMTIQYMDNGLAVEIEDRLYAIITERV